MKNKLTGASRARDRMIDRAGSEHQKATRDFRTDDTERIAQIRDSVLEEMEERGYKSRKRTGANRARQRMIDRMEDR